MDTGTLPKDMTKAQIDAEAAAILNSAARTVKAKNTTQNRNDKNLPRAGERILSGVNKAFLQQRNL